MPNKFYSKIKSTGGGSNKASGSPPSLGMPVKTAAWPGLPGKTQSKSRSGGAPTTGTGNKPFYVKKEGL